MSGPHVEPTLARPFFSGAGFGPSEGFSNRGAKCRTERQVFDHRAKCRTQRQTKAGGRVSDAWKPLAMRAGSTGYYGTLGWAELTNT